MHQQWELMIPYLRRQHFDLQQRLVPLLLFEAEKPAWKGLTWLQQQPMIPQTLQRRQQQSVQGWWEPQRQELLLL
jgi:hypothetical protein